MSDALFQRCSRCGIYRRLCDFGYRPNGMRYARCDACRITKVTISSQPASGAQPTSRAQPTSEIKQRATRRPRIIRKEINPNENNVLPPGYKRRPRRYIATGVGKS